MARTKVVEGEESESGNEVVKEITARRLIKDEEVASGATAIRSEFKDITRRAKELFKRGYIDMPDMKKVRMGDTFVALAKPTDSNKFALFDALFEGCEKMPHLDEYCGRLVDHAGDIIDDHYPVRQWINAANVVGLKELSATDMRKSLKEWALEHKWNDLTQRVDRKLEESPWDGVERMETQLIRMFACEDTKLNHDFSKYFWLSLYARVMLPGEQAPIVLSLFGVQNCGKSYFGHRLAQIITGDPEASSVQLELDGNRDNFMREITGQSIVAAVGEMTGFTRGDMNRIKDFITRTHDKVHYKFEGHFNKARQWITIMDGNKYEGLQRDETGNRRFYPVFCGQLPDKLGQPQWSEDFKADFSGFEKEVWDIMAECHAWFEANGVEGYGKLVRKVSDAVTAFSRGEMAKDRGTIRDEVFDIYLVEMIKSGPKFVWVKKDGTSHIGIKKAEFKRHFIDNVPGSIRPNWKHLDNKISALGGLPHAFSGGYAGYLFSGYNDVQSFESIIGHISGFVADGEITKDIPGKKKDEGF